MFFTSDPYFYYLSDKFPRIFYHSKDLIVFYPNTNTNVLKIGICPQFDTLWEQLTCEETILFYCRLKGVDPKEEKQLTSKTLEEVGLGKFRTLQVTELSGVSQRKKN